MRNPKINESADNLRTSHHKPLFRNSPQSGTAILFIHGILGSPDHFNSLIDLTPSTWTIHNILLSGHGGSVLEFADSSMDEWKQQILNEIDELYRNHDRIMIVGHSMGTLLALYALQKRPEAIQQLFFLNVPLYITLKYPAIVHSFMSMFHWFPSRDMPALAAKDACSIQLTPKFWQYVRWIPRYTELFHEASLQRGYISQIAIPCWVFHSKKDALVSSNSKKLLEKNPRIRLSVLPKSGHYYYDSEDLAHICATFEHACETLEKDAHLKDKEDYMKKIIELRKALHSIAEISGCETKTKALLMDFIQKNTSLTIHPCGQGFYAAHRENDPHLTSIALRADYDALAMPDGTARHLCGHEGHAAILCGAALLSEGQTFGRNVFFLFQPAEETGEGAAECIQLFEKENVDEIYGLHNLPGFPWGQIVTRVGTFACASRGMILRFIGKPAHAAYPEDGISPHMAVGQILSSISNLCSPEKYEGMTLCTVIGVEMGEKAFGAAAAEGEVWLTLRAELNRDLNLLNDEVLALAEKLAAEYGLVFSHKLVDVFPATENHETCTRKVIELLGASELPVPMRWSEDFGHYLLHCPGAYLGIGAGEDYPPLHTENYEFPDSLLEPAIQIWLTLMKS